MKSYRTEIRQSSVCTPDGIGTVGAVRMPMTVVIKVGVD